MTRWQNIRKDFLMAWNIWQWDRLPQWMVDAIELEGCKMVTCQEFCSSRFLHQQGVELGHLLEYLSTLWFCLMWADYSHVPINMTEVIIIVSSEFGGFFPPFSFWYIALQNDAAICAVIFKQQMLWTHKVEESGKMMPFANRFSRESWLFLGNALDLLQTLYY